MYYWLSFCDTDKPAGKAFLGVAIVEADDLETAVSEAWDKEVNPGGEVLAMKLPSEVDHIVLGNVNRLLSASEAENLSEAMNSALELKH